LTSLSASEGLNFSVHVAISFVLSLCAHWNIFASPWWKWAYVQVIARERACG
jgi:hypothetical protein